MQQAARADREPSRLLHFVTRASLAGLVGAVALLSYETENLRYFYPVVWVCVTVYALARGEHMFHALLAYLTSPIMRWRWAFLVLAVASLFWTQRGAAAELVLTLVQIYGMGLIFYDASRHLGEARWVARVAVVAASVGAVHALAGGSHQMTLRVAGAYANPNSLGILSLLALALYYAGADLGRSVVGRILSHALGLVLITAIVASLSRKALFGLVVVWALALAVRGLRRRVAVQMGLAAGMGALLVSLSEPLRLYWDSSLARMGVVFERMTSSAGLDPSLVQRSRFIEKGVALMSKAPLLGHGLHTFLWLSGEQKYAHNNYIELGVSLGIVGVMLYYAFPAALLFGALQPRNRRQFGSRMILILVPTVLMLDLGLVSYYSKLIAFLPILAVGWLERRSAGMSAPGWVERRGGDGHAVGRLDRRDGVERAFGPRSPAGGVAQ